MGSYDYTLARRFQGITLVYYITQVYGLKKKLTFRIQLNLFIFN